MAQKKTPRLVLVDWEDAYSRQNWINDEDIDKDFLDGGYLCTMAGWLIREDKDFIVVAGREGEHHRTYGLLQRIPRGMVHKIRTLR